jgi:hypothetical protein
VHLIIFKEKLILKSHKLFKVKLFQETLNKKTYKNSKNILKKEMFLKLKQNLRLLENIFLNSK